MSSGVRQFIVLATAVTALAAPGLAVAGPIPYQFIAKTYSEALGRATDIGGWNASVARFGSGCNLTTARAQANFIFGSAEYSGRAYTNPQKVMTLYRALLNRDPDPGGLSTWTSYFNSGHTMSDTITQLTASYEFVNHVLPAICGVVSYTFGPFAPPPLPVTGSGLEFPRFGGHLLTEFAQSGRMSADAKDPAVLVGVPFGGREASSEQWSFGPAARSRARSVCAVAA